MAVSGNGWPVSPSAAALGIETMTVGGASFQVRGGQPRAALEYVITQVHNRVEKANAAYGCYGFSYRMNVNSPGTWSNHASGTAVDFNATRHPNGVPTAATFTAAQIAEIHQILAEVGGVVRWGGDYSGTPDAMHFEIDASPEALDVAIDTNAIPENGQIKPIGAPTLEEPSKVPYLTENSVSYPTLMNYGHGYAQWKFDPQQTGTISIDALLSHYSDPAVEAENPQGPVVNLYIFEIQYTSTGAIIPKYGTEQEASPIPGGRLAGQMAVAVEAGKHYIIRTTCTPSFPWIRAVVRIGDYAKVSDWIVPPRVEAIVTLGSRNSSLQESLYFDSKLDSGTGGDDWFLADGHPGEFYSGMIQGPKLKTSYRISTSSFGRAPWAASAGTEAMECAWHWARRFSGSQRWSPGEGLSWYGPSEVDLSFSDHIYPANGAGSATCWVHTEMDQHQRGVYGVTLPVGVRYEATDPLIEWNGEAHRAALFGSMTTGDVIWEMYGGSIHVDFDAIRSSAGISGWGGAWTGVYSSSEGGYRPLYLGEEFTGSNPPSVEWEVPEGKAGIIAVDWALDEWTFPSAQGPQYPQDKASGPGAVAEWYVQKVKREEMVEVYGRTDYNLPTSHPYGIWGPWGDDGWYTRAPGEGPSSFAAAAQYLTTTGGGTTSPWAPLDESYWIHVNDRVIDYDSEWTSDGYPAPEQPGTVRFVVLPRVAFSDSMPFRPPSGYGPEDGDGLVIEDWLQGQSIAIRVTLQPGRYRIIYPAEVPDITYAGGPEINLAPDDKGRVLY